MKNIIFLYLYRGNIYYFPIFHRFTLLHGLLHGEDQWGQINNKSNNQELFMESITINELPPHQLEKCITIQWPEFNIDKNSYVG